MKERVKTPFCPPLFLFFPEFRGRDTFVSLHLYVGFQGINAPEKHQKVRKSEFGTPDNCINAVPLDCLAFASLRPHTWNSSCSDTFQNYRRRHR